jgi:hypothetical protein
MRVIRGSSLALAVAALSACTSHSLPLAAPSSHAPAATPTAPVCGLPSSSQYGAHVEPVSGQPGDTIDVFGTTFRSEEGMFMHSGHLEVWWNARVPPTVVPDAKPIVDGPQILLANVLNMDRCGFHSHFSVPDVRPGSYRIVSFVYWGGGYGDFGKQRFTVEPPKS